MRSATSGQRLRLASHVRACRSDGQVVLLDLRRSRYVGIGSPGSSALVDHVAGWPRNPEWTHARIAATAVEELTGRLVSQGLLTDEPLLDRPPEIPLDEATSSLDLEHAATDSRIDARRLCRFLRIAAVTTLWMRCRSLHAIAAAVAARRDRLQGAARDCGSLDAMRSGTAAYERLRPFVFTAHEKCLHDSLALLGFLAAEGAFPRWVIGVRTRPFGAHSWVQDGATVLNDQHENVRQFRPILVV